MKKRQVQFVALYEDGAHESFLRGYLRTRGYSLKKVFFRSAQPGLGSGKDFVQTSYVEEVRDMRRYARMSSAGTYTLVVMIDQDAPDQPDAYADFDRRLVERGEPRRGEDELISIFAPRYCIETWARYLLGAADDVDEVTDFSQRRYGIGVQECRQAGTVFAHHVPRGDCPLPSLMRGCAERSRIPSR